MYPSDRESWFCNASSGENSLHELGVVAPPSDAQVDILPMSPQDPHGEGERQSTK